MAKRRTKKSTTRKTGVKQVLISLGILFSVILFIINMMTGGVGWLQVFAPVLVAFLLVFILSALKTAVRRV